MEKRYADWREHIESFNDDQRDYYEERAGILQFCRGAGISREAAEIEAYWMTLSRFDLPSWCVASSPVRHG